MINVKNNILNIKNPNTGQYESVPAIVGKSAYDIALENGYEGTKEEWVQAMTKVDNTLSKPNLGADAKVTGDLFIKVNDEILATKKTA